MKPLPNPGRMRGFSVVELMVSVVVGLLAVMFATRLMVSSEQNKSASLGGSDSMQNGMLALFSINSDASQAGWGLNDELVSGCNTALADNEGFQLATVKRGGADITPLAPVIIQNNGNEPDVLSLYSGSAMSGVGSVRLKDNYAGGSILSTDSPLPFGFNRGDVVVVAPEPAGLDCSIAQVSATPDSSNLRIEASGAYRFNAGTLPTNYTGLQARIFVLGRADKLSFHTWSINGSTLRLRATDLAGASQAPQAVIDNVVSLKAQYGFDTRVGPAFTPNDGMQVTQWSSTMVDADNDLTVGSAGDFQRVAAVRIAVVARSTMPERPAAGAATCTVTPAMLTVFAGNAPASVAAVPVQVDLAVPGDPVSWTCYRYRVFETIVPIRNAGWRP
ncbi:PilW family protein [Massilia sp. SM-13]|uniref:PilW family protein n=1 Tax=Pseudoduganella rhizocola TaxID=3382643 RepID=UPI0038B46212